MGEGLWRMSYLHSDLSGMTATHVNTGANDASQFALGYLHKLSKRTALYTNIVSISNKGASAIAVDKNPTLVGGRSSLGFDLGVRHSF
jgi:predicted porin